MRLSQGHTGARLAAAKVFNKSGHTSHSGLLVHTYLEENHRKRLRHAAVEVASVQVGRLPCGFSSYG